MMTERIENEIWTAVSNNLFFIIFIFFALFVSINLYSIPAQ